MPLPFLSFSQQHNHVSESGAEEVFAPPQYERVGVYANTSLPNPVPLRPRPSLLPCNVDRV